jgi:hypothetical protein
VHERQPGPVAGRHVRDGNGSDRKLIDADQETNIYTDEGQSVEVFADKMVQALQGYRREIRLGLHYEGNSAQHTSGATGHDNLDSLVQDGNINDS